MPLTIIGDARLLSNTYCSAKWREQQKKRKEHSGKIKTKHRLGIDHVETGEKISGEIRKRTERSTGFPQSTFRAIPADDEALKTCHQFSSVFSCQCPVIT